MRAFKAVIFALTLGVLLLPGNIYAQNTSMRFSRLTIEDGLSQSTIGKILQDSRGFLWFATEDGLNRYDGYTFTVFKNDPGNSRSISGNSISSMLEDENGNIWIGTKGEGLNRFNRQTEEFRRYKLVEGDQKSLSDNFVTALFEDRSGVILVGTQKGLNIYQPLTDNFIHYKPEPGSQNAMKGEWITSIVEDNEGILWIGTQDQGLNRFDREEGSFTHFSHDPGDPTSLSNNWIEVVYEDREENLWVGTQNGGLNKFERESQTFKHYKHDTESANSLSHNWVLTLFEDRYGEFWVGTLNGLNVFDRTNDRFIDIHTNNGVPDLENKSITSLFEDRSGVFWVGTKDDALYKFVRSTEYFNIYDHNPGSSLSLSDNNVWAVRETFDGSLWVGTQGGGLNRIHPDGQGITYYRHDPEDSTSISDDFVNAIFEDADSTLWVGTIAGLNKFIPSTNGFQRYEHNPDNPRSLTGNIVTTIYQDKLGKVWVGTLNSGLSQLNKETQDFTNYKNDPDDIESLSHNKIWSFYEDRNGVFWVGTHGYGLNKYDRPNDVFGRYYNTPGDTSSISNNFINFIYQDRSRRFWIGTLEGLNEFHPRTETFTRYTVEDGLPNNVIYGIIEDERGHLWLSTNQGISDFDPENKTFRNYDVGDGLPSNEFRFGAYSKGKSGAMYFGGIKGVVAFQADSLRDNLHVPPVAITNFEIYNQPVRIGPDSFLKASVSETSEIKLTYREQVFSFEFAALHYAAPSQNQYAYKMDGFDEEWQHIGDRRFTSFTSMPPDDYVFRVKAANKDGIWNDEGAAIRVSITPPPWQTWWAYLGYAIIGLGLIGGFIQFRIHKERMRKKHLELQNEKLEILVGDRTKELKDEKEKSDKLLYNILPEQVANELKEMGTTKPRQFNNATILFTDFKGFTTTSSSMPPDRLVSELNDIFQHFDGIMEKCQLEKIKTIGDAYMAAAGLPSEDENHALKCVEAARLMMEYINERNKHSSVKWEMRAGIHSGSVIAGVVGRRKFTYDLWGDTVILASRMESLGEEGRVNISASTHELVKDFYRCKYRGKVAVAGRGEFDMYFVEERANGNKKNPDLLVRLFDN